MELIDIFSFLEILFPFEGMQYSFMQRAMAGMLLLSPLVAVMGVQVVNFRMAFYADAISHTSLAGVALGILLGVSPYTTMPLFGVIVGLTIVYVNRRSKLSSDTVTGVFFSAMVAFGLAVISRSPSINKEVSRFIYGDILTITELDILLLAVLAVVLMGFQMLFFNRLLYTGLNTVLAQTHRIPVAVLQYLYAAFLALVVIFSVWWVGVLLVTGMLIIPAAAARNFAKTSGAMFWWSLIISVTSAVAGLLLSSQEWLETASGATIILVASFWFVISLIRK